jgi:hypothetical protein
MDVALYLKLAESSYSSRNKDGVIVMTKDMRICISSPPDREKLVAEIFFGNTEWAELNQESGTLEVEFYTKPDGEFWRLGLDDVLEALCEAKKQLTGEQ